MISHHIKYPDHMVQDGQTIVKSKLLEMARDERFVGCCFYLTKRAPIEVYIKYLKLPEVKPILEATPEELKKRERREKEYLVRKRDKEKRREILKDEDRIVSLTKKHGYRWLRS